MVLIVHPRSRKTPEKVIGWLVFLDSNTKVLKLDEPNPMSMGLTRTSRADYYYAQNPLRRTRSLAGLDQRMSTSANALSERLIQVHTEHTLGDRSLQVRNHQSRFILGSWG